MEGAVSDFYLGVAIFLLLNILAGLVRVLRGPTPADRMLAAQLFGTTGVAILLLLAEAFGLPALRDVALVFVLLGALAAVAFVKRFWSRFGEDGAAERKGLP
jgi:multicomponent Na+:H+ antiporter subunit F